MRTTWAGITVVLFGCLPLACVGDIGATAGAPGEGASGSGRSGAGGRGSPPGGSEAEPGREGALDPGRVTLRRLNRTEYNNTLRDLLGTSLRPADAFQPDPIGFGFDNNGDVQSLTTLQIEQYQGAAEAAVAEVTAGGLDRLAAAARTGACALAPQAQDCIRKLATGLARRAWRRPVTGPEIDRLMAVAAAAGTRGEDALGQLRFALVATLISPHFLFRVELDPQPDSIAAHPVGPFELASRLSYLIYRSMPDDALFEAAEKGRLATAADVRREVSRMLADPRGAELVESFVGQWLDLDGLSEHQVDPALFGDAFDPELARSMRAETVSFFTELLRQNLPVSELLDARFTYVDARLARHYGLGATAPASVTRVQLDGSRRTGLITQASVLTATSAPNRTSPVARGAWVLAQLLCAPPPPPPPDVPALPEAELQAPKNARELLEMHRKDPSCTPCHQVIDPIGLGLENYDAIGRWRDRDNGVPIDAAGMLPDGSTFRGAVELGALLARDPRVASCVASNLFTYAVSRHPASGSPDGQHVERIVRTAGQGAPVRLRDLLLSVVTSEPFRFRRGEPGASSPGGQP
jgi:hypothetical protein